MAISKAFQGKTDKIEQWYGTEYSLERIPEAQIKVGLFVFTIDQFRIPSCCCCK